MRRVHYELIDSTNSEARRLAEMHPGERLLVTASRQSAGRGRNGRRWQSPLGGAWMSLVWPVRKEPRAYAPASLIAAVAVRRAVMELAAGASDDARIKWPNDLLIGDRKVAGILCEQFPGDSATRDAALVIGVGVNVGFDLGLLGRELRHPATTLHAVFGRPVEVEAVVAAVSGHLVEAMEIFEYEGLSEAIHAELQASLAYVQTVRTWNSPRGAITGRVVGVDRSGRLLLECESQRIACEVGEFLTSRAEPRSAGTR